MKSFSKLERPIFMCKTFRKRPGPLLEYEFCYFRKLTSVRKKSLNSLLRLDTFLTSFSNQEPSKNSESALDKPKAT